MDSTLPDAFEASQPGPATGQTLGGGTSGLESIGKTSSAGPFIKADDPPKFELESYIANYTGRTRFDRLYLIGTCSSYLSTEALKAAIAEAKSSKDVLRYECAVAALAEAAPKEGEAIPDIEWIDRTNKVVKSEMDRLEQELKGYKRNLIKESIRMGNEDLGLHYHQTGDLVSASKAYTRMRDYCTTHVHVASMLLKIINVAIERGDWLSVQSNVQRLRNQQPKSEEQAKEQAKNQPKMSAALGLSQLHLNSYMDAANSFLSTDPSLGDSFNEALTSNDVAVYGGLCALASMDRNELQRRVLENSSFRNFLELEPHIRRAISFFCNSKFQPCLEILEAYRTDYLLDIHLQRHVSTLFSRIRTKSIEQYIIPFSRVTLDSMVKVFAPAVVAGQRSPTDPNSPFVQELIQLIQDGVLDARIDLEKMVLVSNQTDLRTEVQRAALDSMQSFSQEAHLRLLRTNIIRAGLEVRPPVDKRAAVEEHVGGLGGKSALSSMFRGEKG